MGLFSRLTGKLSKHTGDKRAHKSAGKHHSHRSEYLLNEDVFSYSFSILPTNNGSIFKKLTQGDPA